MTSYIYHSSLVATTAVFTLPIVTVGFLLGRAIKFLNPKTMLTPSGIAVASLVATSILTTSVPVTKSLYPRNRALVGFINVSIGGLALYYSAKLLSSSSRDVKILAALQAAILFHSFVIMSF